MTKEFTMSDIRDAIEQGSSGNPDCIWVPVWEAFYGELLTALDKALPGCDDETRIVASRTEDGYLSFTLGSGDCLTQSERINFDVHNMEDIRRIGGDLAKRYATKIRKIT
jgi:hypothetical protein